jgi:hypothetical protein
MRPCPITLGSKLIRASGSSAAVAPNSSAANPNTARASSRVSSIIGILATSSTRPGSLPDSYRIAWPTLVCSRPANTSSDGSRAPDATTAAPLSAFSSGGCS